MKAPTIILGFSRYSNGALAVKARHIISRMTGNTYFPDPFPKLEDVTARADAYDAALQTLDRSEARKLAFAQERQALERCLRQLGLYVLQHGEDDPVILESSGYDLSKVPVKRTAIPVGVEGFKVKTTEPSGCMFLRFNAVAGAKAYYFQYTPAPVTEGSQWTSIGNTRPFKVLDGLTPGVEYAFRICVVAADTRQVYSQVIRRHVS